MAGSGKTLTALGSYWKGRKPLILNKACILGCLLPSTDDPVRDLEIFEMLMGMDDRSLAYRLGRIKPEVIVSKVTGLTVDDWFTTVPKANLPYSTPFNINDFPVEVSTNGVNRTVVPKLLWKDTLNEGEKLKAEAMALPYPSHSENVSEAKRPEELGDGVHAHIWDDVNRYLGTNAKSFPELVEQMGIARFGHRPKVADVFSGSGQIPFEAGRLGCDVYASDLNPIACMLTWGALNIVGASPEKRKVIDQEQQELVEKIQKEIDDLGIEEDGNGWRAKVYLYCVEVRCPETGWMVPLIPSFVISQPRNGIKKNVVLKLRPLLSEKRYEIEVVEWVDGNELSQYESGTFQKGMLVHSPDGATVHRVKVSTIRGDYKENGVNRNNLRLWEKNDIVPRPDDIFQERLYCVQWIKPKGAGKQFDYEFREVTPDDLIREAKVIDYVSRNLSEWQEQGYVPDMKIEPGTKTDEPIRTRGWTHWHHLFNPRQLLIAAMANMKLMANGAFGFSQLTNWNSRLCRWNIKSGGGGSVQDTFYNQALNTILNYGCRSSSLALSQLSIKCRNATIPDEADIQIKQHIASRIKVCNDLYITDPPYGDAVKYEEITEFFIAWLRKNPPKEFADWTWDSRRALAIKGEDEAFRQGMIAAYRNMAEHMPDNGMQVLMFTHQSGSIWADMANIIWASGLQVTAAWYIVTETDSALRQGANVTGTIMLVLRKRLGEASSFRDDLGWEIEEAVKVQIEGLTGLDQKLRDRGSEGLYTDADLQMAGYAAALKVLTAYSNIDGKDMVTEAEAPKQEGRKSFVEELIEFAVQTAVQFLVPVGFEKGEWQKLSAIERFYLKMAEMENQGAKILDNYQNFAKAFKVKHFDQVMSDGSKANNARLKLSTEFKGSQVTGEGELPGTPLRALLYALFEMSKDMEVEDVLIHLAETHPNYYQDKQLLAKMADYLATKRSGLNSTKTFDSGLEAKNARILAEAIRNQKL